MKRYSDTHEWAELEGDKIKIGVSHFAQKELGDIVYVELPKVGKHVTAGKEAAVLESTKAAADVYSPLSGTIIEVNGYLAEKPDLVNSAPETEGWLFIITPDDVKEIETLMDSSAYSAKVGKS